MNSFGFDSMASKLLNHFRKTGKTYWRETLAVLFLLVAVFFFRSERRTKLGDNTLLTPIAWIWVGVVLPYFYHFTKRNVCHIVQTVSTGFPGDVPLNSFEKKFLSVFLPAGGISSLAYSPDNLRKEGLTK
jgi:phosphatidylglycerol lysyltransferase